jgi:putative FmdB family regulatory protein
MPLYSYVCTVCQRAIESIEKVDTDALPGKCTCGAGVMVRDKSPEGQRLGLQIKGYSYQNLYGLKK